MTYFANAKAGKRADLGDTHWKSRSEANYGRYLNFLIKNNIDGVVRWEYEPDTFHFEKIKRGTRFYTPDFKIFYQDGSYEYHEVKGYDYPRGITQRKRFAKYFPQHKLILIDVDWFKAAKRQGIDTLVPGWEYGGKSEHTNTG